MGTRSRIARKNADGSFTSIYCHWDGYPSNNGDILQQHYTDPAKVDALMAAGNLSALAALPAPAAGQHHTFGSPALGVSIAYGRDRGETRQEAQQSGSLEALNILTQQTGGEWLYVFDGGVWLCAMSGISAFGNPASAPPSELRPVADWLAEQADED